MAAVIRAVRAHPFSVALRAPLRTAAGTLTHRQGVLVELEDGDGVIGLGEACPLPAAGAPPAPPAELMRAVRDLIPRLVGLAAADVLEAIAALLDPCHGPAVLAGLCCAFDTAGLDLEARQRSTNVAHLLADRPAGRVAVNALVSAPAARDAADEAARAAAEGFGTVKLKVGLAQNLETECRRIAAVRAAIGSSIRLRLDANGAWSPDKAIRILDLVAGHDIELVEQPVPPSDLDGARQVRQRAPMPIAADEGVTGIESARRVLEAGAADLLVIKPMVAGGPSAGCRIADLAAAAGARCLVTTTLDTAVGTSAALHLAASLVARFCREHAEGPGAGPEPPACGLATLRHLEHPLGHGVPAPRQGWMVLSDRPGLGVELDREALLEHGPNGSHRP